MLKEGLGRAIFKRKKGAIGKDDRSLSLSMAPLAEGSPPDAFQLCQDLLLEVALQVDKCLGRGAVGR